jgi:hypothetical protein
MARKKHSPEPQDAAELIEFNLDERLRPCRRRFSFYSLPQFFVRLLSDSDPTIGLFSPIQPKSGR